MRQINIDAEIEKYGNPDFYAPEVRFVGYIKQKE